MDERDDGSMTQQNNDFLARLGLETDPFPVEPDSSFYYENPDLMQRLDMIQHLIGFSNQMIFITGEKGIGKTSMLERLEYYAPDHWRICRIQANPMLNTPILLRQLTSGFELEVMADADDMFQVYSEALQDHIETLERAMLTPVVLIDDAHELPIDAFTMLFGFMQQEGGHSNLKMALFCEPQITTMLDTGQLKSLSQNLTHQLEIPPFDEQQTGEYLEQRLNHAGLSTDFPFPPETIHKIHQHSQGVAGAIHTFAQQALLDEDSQSLPVVDEILDFDEDPAEEEFPAMATTRAGFLKENPIGRKFHSWQIGAVAAVLALLAGVLWLTTQIGDSTESTIAEEIPLDITPGPVEPPAPPVVQQPAEQDPTLFEESTSIPQMAAVDPDITSPEPMEENQNTPEPTPDSETNTGEKTSDPLDEFVQTLESQPSTGIDTGSANINQQQNEVTVEIDENGNPQIVDISKPEPAVVNESVTAPAEQLPVEQPPAEQPAVVQTPVVQAVPEPVQLPVIKPAPVVKPSISGVKDESWLRAQNDSHIVLQLLGTHDQLALKKILSENALGDDIAWFTTIHNGEPWYVITKGPFQDRTSATASISSLPDAFRKRKPWPRTIASVKKAMDEAP